MPPKHPKDNISFLRMPQVREITGLPRSSIYAKIAIGEFPRPIGLGARAVAWISSEIDNWINARIAERNGGAK
jgi:prophage regulatory protein